MRQKTFEAFPSRNSSIATLLASTQVGEKGWGPTGPQAFRRKLFACLAQIGKSLSQLPPLYMDLFGMRSRGGSWEMPCARQAVVVVCWEVIFS